MAIGENAKESPTSVVPAPTRASELCLPFPTGQLQVVHSIGKALILEPDTPESESQLDHLSIGNFEKVTTSPSSFFFFFNLERKVHNSTLRVLFCN